MKIHRESRKYRPTATTTHECCNVFASQEEIARVPPNWEELETSRKRSSCIYCRCVRSAKSRVYGARIPREIRGRSRRLGVSCATIVLRGAKIQMIHRRHALAETAISGRKRSLPSQREMNGRVVRRSFHGGLYPVWCPTSRSAHRTRTVGILFILLSHVIRITRAFNMIIPH